MIPTLHQRAWGAVMILMALMLLVMQGLGGVRLIAENIRLLALLSWAPYWLAGLVCFIKAVRVIGSWSRQAHPDNAASQIERRVAYWLAVFAAVDFALDGPVAVIAITAYSYLEDVPVPQTIGVGWTTLIGVLILSLTGRHLWRGEPQ